MVHKLKEKCPGVTNVAANFHINKTLKKPHSDMPEHLKRYIGVAGLEELIEDFKEASKVTRDYIFDLNEDGSQAPLLNIYGGKLTTYRKLAENVLLTLNKHIPINKENSWTAKQKL